LPIAIFERGIFQYPIQEQIYPSITAGLVGGENRYGNRRRQCHFLHQEAPQGFTHHAYGG
jgi:hypothetical protein